MLRALFADDEAGWEDRGRWGSKGKHTFIKPGEEDDQLTQFVPVTQGFATADWIWGGYDMGSVVLLRGHCKHEYS